MNHKSPEEIDDKIDQWHKESSAQPTYEYLGMTKDEYFKFVEDGNSIVYEDGGNSNGNN